MACFCNVKKSVAHVIANSVGKHCYRVRALYLLEWIINLLPVFRKGKSSRTTRCRWAGPFGEVVCCCDGMPLPVTPSGGPLKYETYQQNSHNVIVFDTVVLFVSS